MIGRAEARLMAVVMPLRTRGQDNRHRARALAALAVWRYCFNSARFIFGDSLGHSVADVLLAALTAAGAMGLSRAGCHATFSVGIARRGRSRRPSGTGVTN
jgi:hypothetical protein